MGTEHRRDGRHCYTKLATLLVHSSVQSSLPAGVGTCGIVTAVAHALVAPSLTDIEGQGLGVLSDVGRYIVFADA